MAKQELEKRTKEFALRVIGFVGGLPKNKVTEVLGYQLLIPLKNPLFTKIGDDKNG